MFHIQTMLMYLQMYKPFCSDKTSKAQAVVMQLLSVLVMALALTATHSIVTRACLGKF